MAGEIALISQQAIAVGVDHSDTQTLKPAMNQRSSQTKVHRMPPQHTVGVVTYRQNRLMTVPWNTVMNQFQYHLSDEPLEDVAEYLNFFMKAAKLSGVFKEPEVIQNHLINLTVDVLETHISAAHSEFPNGNARMDQFGEVLSRMLQTYYSQTPDISAEWSGFIDQYYPLIEAVVTQFRLYDFHLPELVLGLSMEQLAMSILYHICHGSRSGYDTEIAFFGYGTDNEVPGLFTLKIQSIFEETIVGKLGIATTFPEGLDSNAAVLASLRAGTKGDLYHQSTLTKENLNATDLVYEAQTIVEDIVSDTIERTDVEILNKKRRYILVTKERGVEYYTE